MKAAAWQILIQMERIREREREKDKGKVKRLKCVLGKEGGSERECACVKERIKKE